MADEPFRPNAEIRSEAQVVASLVDEAFESRGESEMWKWINEAFRLTAEEYQRRARKHGEEGTGGMDSMVNATKDFARCEAIVLFHKKLAPQLRTLIDRRLRANAIEPSAGAPQPVGRVGNVDAASGRVAGDSDEGDGSGLCPVPHLRFAITSELQRRSELP